MKKSLVLVVLLVVLLTITTAPAFARWQWCAADPEVVLPDGQGSVHVWAAVPEEDPGTIITMYLTVPEGAVVLNHAGDVNINVIVNEEPGHSNRIVARVHADAPVRVWADGVFGEMKDFEFKDGKGTAKWHW